MTYNELQRTNRGRLRFHAREGEQSDDTGKWICGRSTHYQANDMSVRVFEDAILNDTSGLLCKNCIRAFNEGKRG